MDKIRFMTISHTKRALIFIRITVYPCLNSGFLLTIINVHQVKEFLILKKFLILLKIKRKIKIFQNKKSNSD